MFECFFVYDARSFPFCDFLELKAHAHTSQTVGERKLYLNEFEDGESGRALVGVNAAQYAVELRVEAAVAESEQEAAQQGDGHAEEKEVDAGR